MSVSEMTHGGSNRVSDNHGTMVTTYASYFIGHRFESQSNFPDIITEVSYDPAQENYGIIT
jgi:uncharacterized protein Veg